MCTIPFCAKWVIPFSLRDATRQPNFVANDYRRMEDLGVQEVGSGMSIYINQHRARLHPIALPSRPD